MARLGRHCFLDQPLHVIQCGNNHEAILFAEDDARAIAIGLPLQPLNKAVPLRFRQLCGRKLVGR